MCICRLLRRLRRPPRKRIYQLDENSAFDLPTRSRTSLPVRSELSVFLYQVHTVRLQGGVRPLLANTTTKLTARDRRFFYGLMLRRRVRQEVPLERLSEFMVMSGVLMLGGPLRPVQVLSRRRSA